MGLKAMIAMVAVRLRGFSLFVEVYKYSHRGFFVYGMQVSKRELTSDPLKKKKGVGVDEKKTQWEKSVGILW